MPPDPSASATAAAMKSPLVRMPPEPDTVIVATTFPLVFSDGARESPAGTLVVSSNTDLAAFKARLAKKLRGEPHRVAAFLVRRKRGKSFPGRKTPIDDSTDFAALVRQRDCHVLALFRRSPPRRPRRPPKGGAGGGGFVMPDPPAVAAAAAWERQLQMQKLQIQNQKLERERERERERLARYPCSVGEARQRYTDAVGDVRRRGAAVPPPVCGVCNAARWLRGQKPEFHLCVHDQVVDNFKTVAGAIGRPGDRRR